MSASTNRRRCSAGIASAGRSGSGRISSKGLGSLRLTPCCTSCVASSPNISIRCDAPAARPSPVSTRSSDRVALSRGVFASELVGSMASARLARSTPLPSFWLLPPSALLSAEVKRAWRTASTRIHGSPYCATRARCLVSQRAAAAATCGVALEVPAPSRSTTFPAPCSAHGMLGVKAAMAVAILLAGPQLPCIFRIGRL